MKLPEKEFVIIDGQKIYFFVYRKNIKNINLRVNKNKEIIVSIPQRTSIEKAKNFIKSKIDWVRKQQSFWEKYETRKDDEIIQNDSILYILGKQYKVLITPSKKLDISIENNYIKIRVKQEYINNQKYLKKAYEDWLKRLCKNVTTEIVGNFNYVLQKNNIKFPMIEVRKMKSRWGSCYAFKNKIVFNLSLIKTPIECVEYVVLHEISHFKYQNHSKNFYNFIAQYIPDWKKRRIFLNKEYSGII